jgi:UPF0755 protein
MMKKRGHGAMIAVFLVTIVIFGVTYGAWTTVTTVFAPPALTQTTQISLVIQSGETTPEIADDLYKRGLIRNPLAFRIWARVKGLDTQLQAGAYLLTPGMSIDQMIAKLQNGQPDEKRLAVIDGWRLEQIAAQASQAGLANFNEQQFLTYTHHPGQFPDAAKFPILQNAPSMEGLLYPDTYLIPASYNTVQVIDMMLTEFDQVVQQNNLVALAQQHQLTEYQMVVLASIAQREASNAGQMPLIAGIYWKRIYQPSSDVGGPYLKSDPTVEYARETDNPPSDGKYWQDLNNFGTGPQVDPNSPWNTYTHSGWTPTPIASPNLYALKAAASPAQTNCYYFFSKPDGSLVCEPTYRLMLQNE